MLLMSARSHVRPLFSTRKLAINSSLVIMIWGCVATNCEIFPSRSHNFFSLLGLAYPLFNGFLVLYLQDRISFDDTLNKTYRDYVIVGVLGIPGSMIACVIVDWTRNSGRFAIGGRKFALAISTLATGLFLFLFTTATTESAYLGYSCASSLTQ